MNFVDPLGLWEDPVEFWKDFAGGASDFERNYQELQEANKDPSGRSDKYYHCMANCQASRRGFGGEVAAEWISDTREFLQEKFGQESSEACDADRKANEQGRKGDRNLSCAQVCGSL